MTTRLTLQTDGTYAELAKVDLFQALTALAGITGGEIEAGVYAQLPIPDNQPLPFALAISGTNADLAAFGWRLNAGASRALNRVKSAQQELLETMQFAWLGSEATLCLNVLGPVTLAHATMLKNGERSISDLGAVRDIPELLAQGILDFAAEIKTRLPQTKLALCINEPSLEIAQTGKIKSSSGYRHYPALGKYELTAAYAPLAQALDEYGLSVSIAGAKTAQSLNLLAAAGFKHYAISPVNLGNLNNGSSKQAWETLAELTSGSSEYLTLVSGASHIDDQIKYLFSAWRELGLAPTDLTGLTMKLQSNLIPADPASMAEPVAGLNHKQIAQFIEYSPRWADQITE